MLIQRCIRVIGLILATLAMVLSVFKSNDVGFIVSVLIMAFFLFKILFVPIKKERN